MRDPQPAFEGLPTPIRLGYVGCGFMAQNVHLPNFRSVPGCELVALAEKRSALREKVAAKFEIPARYGSHLELACDPQVDAVAVSAGFVEQGEIAADLLRAGKHVFMEKPMAVSQRQAERMLGASRDGQSRLMVAYMKRFDPGNVWMADLVASWRREGTAGNALLTRNHGFCGDWLVGLDLSQMIRTEEPIEPWTPTDQLPGWMPPEHHRAYINYLQQYTHNVNLLRYLLEADRRDLVRVEQVAFDSDGFTGIAILRLAGVRCVIESATSNFHAWDENTQIFFQDGWIRAETPPFFARSATTRLEVYTRKPHPELRYPLGPGLNVWPYLEEANHFIQSLQSGTPFRSSGEDAFLDVVLNEEIYRAYLQGKRAI
ncbi:MAG TPA: Gfo/Idh/MocA family oxidoreductase [Chthoniobacterales bacterium]